MPPSPPSTGTADNITTTDRDATVTTSYTLYCRSGATYGLCTIGAIFDLDTVLTPLRTLGTANQLVGVDSAGTALEYKGTINIQLKDDAAQIASATASKGTLKFLATSITDAKLVTVTPVCTDNCTITTESYGAVTKVLVDKDTAQTLTNKSIASLTPVIDDPDNFAANFTGANLYGGTFIANAAGTAALPDPAAGMNFTIVLETTGQVIIDPLNTGTADAIIMNGLAAADDENITTPATAVIGSMCVFQYRSADHWMATCNGFVEATPP